MGVLLLTVTIEAKKNISLSIPNGQCYLSCETVEIDVIRYGYVQCWLFWSRHQIDDFERIETENVLLKQPLI